MSCISALLVLPSCQTKSRVEGSSYLQLFMATSTVALFIAQQLVVVFVFPLWPSGPNCFLCIRSFFVSSGWEWLWSSIKHASTQACADSLSDTRDTHKYMCMKRNIYSEVRFNRSVWLLWSIYIEIIIPVALTCKFWSNVLALPELWIWTNIMLCIRIWLFLVGEEAVKWSWYLL